MDIIRIKNEGYAEYEELLLLRDRLRKEAYMYNMHYMKEFGDLITKLFEKQIECIKLKKMIEYCLAELNRSSVIDSAAMHEKISKEMQEYNDHLNDMIKSSNAAKNMGKISEVEVIKIKKIYRNLVKILHPDVNPKTEQIPELKNLWQMISAAYNANDLEELEEADVMARRLLEENDIAGMEIEIPDISEKIEKIRADIDEIKSTDPYRYKFLLEDPDAVEEKKKSLKEDFDEFAEYADELEKAFKELTANGGSFTWQMN